MSRLYIMSSTEKKDTRESILQATYDLVTAGGDPTVSMGAVADRAGISRQAVYLHFDSRTELLLELVRWVDRSLGLGELLGEARREADPVERAVAIARVSARYESEIKDIALAIDIARHSDDAAAAAWDDRMSGRRRDWEEVFADIDAAGRLADRWTPRRAAQAYWSVTSPSSYRDLIDDCEWSEEDYEAWIVTLLKEVFLVDE